MKQLRLLLLMIILLYARMGYCQQNFSFTSGPIPMCDTTTFTSNVSGIGQLYPYNMGNFWNYTLYTLTINITSNHPQTLSISLTSPQGTTLLLSAFNGSGGINYTNCEFNLWATTNITTGSAPFNGFWIPQGGPLSAFDYENADGTWTITIIDTACSGPGGSGGGGGGAWTPGYFNGGSGGNGIFGFSPSSPPPPPPTPVYLNPINLNLCPGSTVDIDAPLASMYPGFSFYYTFQGVPFGNPHAANTAGTYDGEYYDPSFNTIYYVSINVTNVAGPSLGADQTASLSCSGTAIDLNTLLPTTGFNMSWSLGGVPLSGSQITACTTPGYYQAIAENSYGCTDTAYVTLNGSGVLSLGGNQSANFCNNTTIDLTVLYNTSGLTCSWTLNNVPVANPSSINTSGNYQLIATAGSCSDTVYVNVVANAPPSLGNDQIISACNLFPYDLSGLFNLTGLSADWTLSGTPVLNPGNINTSGIYELVATDVNGCSDTALATLTQYPSPNLGADQTASTCSNTDIDLTVLFSNAGNSSAWYFNGTTTIPPTGVSTSGIYTLISTNSSGCSDTANITLQSYASPYLGADQTTDICQGATYDLTGTFSATGLSGNWTYNNAPVVNPSAVTQSGLYQIIVTDLHSCSDTALLQLNLIQAPALGNDQQVNICSGDVIDLTGLYTTAGWNTTWTLNGAVVSLPQQASVAGTYQLIAINNTGCADTAFVQLTVNPLPTAGAPAIVNICQGASTDLTLLYNTTGLSTTWYFNGSPVSNPSSVSAAGIYQLELTNSAGCKATTYAQVNYHPTPALGADQQLTPCEGNTIDLTALYNTSGLNTGWTSGGTPVSNPGQILTSGLYELIAINNQGCSDTADVTINFTTAPDPGDDISYDLCPWQSVDLTQLYPAGTNTATYFLNGQTYTTPQAAQDSGLYTVIFTNAAGCTGSAEVTIHTVQCKCEADFDYTAHCIQNPGSFELKADSAILSAEWSFDGAAAFSTDINPVVSFHHGGELTVIASVILSCGTVDVKKEIKIEDCSDSCHVWIPDAFSPNNDLKNDAFTWQGDCQPEKFTLDIYNRFGQRVFHTNDPEAGWTGTTKGVDVAGGIYSYNIHLKLPYQDETDLSGKLMLIR